MGDFVGLPDKRNFYSKDFTTNWKRERFEIHSINNTCSINYFLEDENKEIIQGKGYEQKLLLSAFNFNSNSKTLQSMNILHELE